MNKLTKVITIPLGIVSGLTDSFSSIQKVLQNKNSGYAYFLNVFGSVIKHICAGGERNLDQVARKSLDYFNITPLSKNPEIVQSFIDETTSQGGIITHNHPHKVFIDTLLAIYELPREIIDRTLFIISDEQALLFEHNFPQYPYITMGSFRNKEGVTQEKKKKVINDLRSVTNHIKLGGLVYLPLIGSNYNEKMPVSSIYHHIINKLNSDIPVLYINIGGVVDSIKDSTLWGTYGGLLTGAFDDSHPISLAYHLGSTGDDQQQTPQSLHDKYHTLQQTLSHNN